MEKIKAGWQSIIFCYQSRQRNNNLHIGHRALKKCVIAFPNNRKEGVKGNKKMRGGGRGGNCLANKYRII